MKESLHLACRLEANEDLPRFVADVRPDVRQLAWREKGIAGSQSHFLLSDLEDILALHYIKPFLLVVMEMPRWSAFAQADLLEQKQPAMGVLTGNLVHDVVCPSDGSLLVEPIG